MRLLTYPQSDACHAPEAELVLSDVPEMVSVAVSKPVALDTVTAVPAMNVRNTPLALETLTAVPDSATRNRPLAVLTVAAVPLSTIVSVTVPVATDALLALPANI